MEDPVFKEYKSELTHRLERAERVRTMTNRGSVLLSSCVDIPIKQANIQYAKGSVIHLMPIAFTTSLKSIMFVPNQNITTGTYSLGIYGMYRKNRQTGYKPIDTTLFSASIGVLTANAHHDLIKPELWDKTIYQLLMSSDKDMYGLDDLPEEERKDEDGNNLTVAHDFKENYLNVKYGMLTLTRLADHSDTLPTADTTASMMVWGVEMSGSEAPLEVNATERTSFRKVEPWKDKWGSNA